MVFIVACWTSWSYIRTCHSSLQMVIKRENIITDQDYSHIIIIHVPREPKALQIFYFWSLKSITSGSKLALIGLGKKITGRQAPDEYSRYSEDKYKYIVIFSSIILQICICKHSLQSLPWMLRGYSKMVFLRSGRADVATATSKDDPPKNNQWQLWRAPSRWISWAWAWANFNGNLVILFGINFLTKV